MRQERLRKSDHLNPLADVPDLDRVARGRGFRIARIRFYTPIVGGFVENILMRVAERAMAGAPRAASGAGVSRCRCRRDAVRKRDRPQRPRSRATPRPTARLRAVAAMRLDLLLFGWTSGPFFALLEKEAAGSRLRLSKLLRLVR